MRVTGSRVAGRGWRPLRHHSRLSRKVPRGVAPSPSRLLALMPPRPSATGSASGPAVGPPRLGAPAPEAVRILRKNGCKAPIIMLTGHDTDSDTILGLESGANDYVTKPFRFAVLLARIRAQLRQHEASEDAVFTIGPYTFRPSAKLLVNPKGNKVRLTEKETAILRYLYRAGRRAISREILLQEVWGYNSGVTTHTLETHIYRLRQKVEQDASNPSILVTEAGGYKLLP